jgi:Holliday junction resolvasome RuvABC endonuclease subunit
MTLILGIDPGKKGALAVFDKGAGRVATHDMPTTTIALHDFISGLPAIRIAVIEKPFYPPHIGILSVSKIAEAYGTLKGALAWRSIPMQEVRPSEWKRALNLSSSKAASREKAGQIFPDDADQWTRVMDDGRAEAALIAWYGLRWVR